ncbi:enzyme inhibitor [Stemphylium lycopersici]|uniref:ATPase inhibitor, mitochondrial n=1 Tax=Stemphylium lycopersici TaxID=183478 RepID=A0A364N6I6_STELY|nr:atpase inhibitor [Stemphylium lycopersici]RAR02821.1 enzyme inhibitor [Stemphylium lycopersici]RAR12870.1 enzyme inhibitor [Stemphylium lycopersici]
MFRTSIIKSARSIAAPRYFSASALRMAEGATGSGSSRPTGTAGGDAFTKREAASEELYIRQEEKAKYVQLGTVDDTTRLHTIRTLAVRIQGIFLTADRLMAIKEKLRMQRQHMDDLDKHIDDVIRESEASGQGEQK